jgi:hypothetical protein
MPSYEKSANNIKGQKPLSPYSYDKLISFTQRHDDNRTLLSKIHRVSVSLVDGNNYNDVLNNTPSGSYDQLAGCDLSNIFMPFETSLGPPSGIPSFAKNADVRASGIESQVHLADILPFRWDKNQTSFIQDRWKAPSGDSMNSMVSSDHLYGNDGERYRDVSNIRTVGLRLPAMGIGWGYTLDGKPFPSGLANEGGATKFKGGFKAGFEVDPADYVAAPIDLRYDTKRNVWTCTGGLPPGKGRFKVLMIIDDLDPGTVVYDYPRFN